MSLLDPAMQSASGSTSGTSTGDIFFSLPIMSVNIIEWRNLKKVVMLSRSYHLDQTPAARLVLIEHFLLASPTCLYDFDSGDVQ
jgi:hypothetical protein